MKLNFSFEVIESVNKLKEILSYDNYKGKRGIFLTFAEDERNTYNEFGYPLKDEGGHGFDNFEYGIFLILKEDLKEKDENKIKNYVKSLKDSIKEDMIENWPENPALKQKIERRIRDICLEIKMEYGLEYEKFDLTYKKIFEFIKEYGS